IIWRSCVFLCLFADVDAVIVVLNCNIEKYYGNRFVVGLHYSDSSLNFGAGFSSNRFNSKASSNLDYQLIIKQAEEGDSAQYFCQTWDDSASAAVSQ
uniref:Immunoglobulin V-set domain-containing protein n=1 Tax=Amphiprion percula TaxID=161767 RepID=A0A3P8S172_AMPPE